MRHIVLHEKISAKGMENMSDKNKSRIGNIGSIGIGGILCAAFAVIALALCVILMAYTESEPAGIVLTVLVVYVVVAVVTIVACQAGGYERLCFRRDNAGFHSESPYADARLRRQR